jgi:hypothetical protein
MFELTGDWGELADVWVLGVTKVSPVESVGE